MLWLCSWNFAAARERRSCSVSGGGRLGEGHWSTQWNLWAAHSAHDPQADFHRVRRVWRDNDKIIFPTVTAWREPHEWQTRRELWPVSFARRGRYPCPVTQTSFILTTEATLVIKTHSILILHASWYFLVSQHRSLFGCSRQMTFGPSCRVSWP